MKAITWFAFAAVVSTAFAQTPGQSLYEQAVSTEVEAGRATVDAAGKNAAAVRLYIRAARAGNGKAARRLSEIYQTGIEGVPPNPTETLNWHDEARRLGETHPAPPPFPQAAEQTADLAAARALESQGKGPEAVKVYIRLAGSGNGKAAHRLGEIYLKGIAGVRRAAAESRKWFNAAQGLGYPPVLQCRLALCQQAFAAEMEGRGEEAAKLYITAARSGDGQAAKHMGEIYEKGRMGIQRDYSESLKWYNAARALGENVPMTKIRQQAP
jgi:TPR repeat protein